MTIHTLETNYTGRLGFAACYLVENNGRFVLIENNTVPCWPTIFQQMLKLGVRAHNLDFHFITHIHLDHAGATGEMSKYFPHTPVLGHPRAMRHAADPERLIKSARQVYGEKIFQQLYGDISAVAKELIREVSDGEVVEWGEERIHVLHTEGHAKHHACFYFTKAEVVFTGDTFGIHYPELQKPGKLFIFPSTSPTDFDPKQAIISVQRLAQLHLQRPSLTFYPTHFGPLHQIQLAKQRLILFLEHSSQLCDASISLPLHGQELVLRLHTELTDYYQQHLKKLEMSLTTENWELLQLDLQLNAQGLAYRIENLRSRQ